MPHTLDVDHERRFGGLDRLHGDGTRTLLHLCRVAVVGVGGVGSWAVEALARSGIGNLTLIDFDHVAVSNINRQIQALDSTLGAAKVQVLKSRIHDINPACKVTVIEDFLTGENMSRLIPPGAFDAVIDACDNARAKASLIAHAQRNQVFLVVCGAAGGKRDPLKLRVADLGRVTHDALLARIRNQLRRESRAALHKLGARKNGKFGVNCIYLEEPSSKGGACTTGNLSCSGYGSVVTVTAAMGFAAASLCLDRLAKPPQT